MEMKYRCKICGYSGKEFIFEMDDFSYCLASNRSEPEYMGKPPEWLEDKGPGEAIIGEIVGCPRCHAWGNDNFEII
jgi:hypothetical protein